MTVNIYLRTSKEFQGIHVEKTVNGNTTKVTSGVQYVAVPKGTPLDQGTLQTPSLLDGEIGFYTDQLAAGYWDIGVRVTASTETPLIPCGTIRIK